MTNSEFIIMVCEGIIVEVGIEDLSLHTILNHTCLIKVNFFHHVGLPGHPHSCKKLFHKLIFLLFSRHLLPWLCLWHFSCLSFSSFLLPSSFVILLHIVSRFCIHWLRSLFFFFRRFFSFLETTIGRFFKKWTSSWFFVFFFKFTYVG